MIGRTGPLLWLVFQNTSISILLLRCAQWLVDSIWRKIFQINRQILSLFKFNNKKIIITQNINKPKREILSFFIKNLSFVFIIKEMNVLNFPEKNFTANENSPCDNYWISSLYDWYFRSNRVSNLTEVKNQCILERLLISGIKKKEFVISFWCWKFCNFAHI